MGTPPRRRPPKPPAATLRRPRLDGLLDRLFEQSAVVLLSASSGSGKTVQAQLYTADREWPTAWATLSSSDISPHRLLATLLEALEELRPPQAQGQHNPAFRMAASLPEAAAVAAGSIVRKPAFLVVDECQHLMQAPEALDALDIFLGAIPDTLRVLLLSSGKLKGPIEQRLVERSIRLITDVDLALTADENSDLAALLTDEGGETESADKVLAATGGWMAGAVFSYRYGLREQSAANHLPTVVMTAVLDRLPAEEAQFLLDTSVADAVTRPVAIALCGDEGHRLWDTVRSRHLPATSTSEEALVYHSLFQSFLQRRLLSTDPGRRTRLVRSYASYLSGEGHFEQAGELLLSVGDMEGAFTALEGAVAEMLGRSDWTTFMRWADRLGHGRLARSPRLMAGLIRAQFGLRRFEETIGLIRDLDQAGALRPCMEADPALLATAAWALQSDIVEARRLLQRYDGDYRADVMRFMTEAVSELRPATPPIGRDWGDFERTYSWGLFLQGRTKELAQLAPTDPTAPAVNPNVVLGLTIAGDLTGARDLIERVPPELRQRPHGQFIETMLLMAEGEIERAFATLEAALSDSHHSPYTIAPAYKMFYGWALFQLGRADDAAAVLRQRIEAAARTGHLAILEWGQAFLGCVLLSQGRPEEARTILEECVRSMESAQRRLYLPFAAAALSEAQARTGDADAAHESADLAYRTAAMMGTMSTLLPIVRRFPSIVEREDRRDGMVRRWRRLVVAPSARPVRRSPALGTMHLSLQPFGQHRDISVNGTALGIGRLKIIELTALLILRPHGIDRAKLQGELFPDATPRNGGNHFRQICFKFRQITGLSLDRRNGTLIGLPQDTVAEAADLRFEELASSASTATGEERVARLQAALSLVKGPYLDGSELVWAEERRAHLAVVEEEARVELVSLLLDHGRPDEARDECEELLRLNPYSDPGYRLLVRIERMAGSETSVLAAYRRAVAALDELGLRPGDARALLGLPRQGPAPGGEPMARPGHRT